MTIFHYAGSTAAATWAAQAKREDEAREREDRVLAEKMQVELNQSSEEQGRAAAKEK